MSNVLKNIKSLFIVEETEGQNTSNQSEQKQTTNTQTSQTPPPIPNAGNQNTTSIPGVGVIDQRIFDSLQKALEENNQPGFDFLEFKNSLQTLATIIPDEATRYKSAYATAATMGLTVEKLLDSAKFYQGILSREKDNFDKAVLQQVDLNVTAKQKEAERLQNLIQQKAEQIKKLTEEITAHQEEMNKAQGFISEAANKIEATKSNFYTTLDAVNGQIQNDITNIEKFLR